MPSPHMMNRHLQAGLVPNISPVTALPCRKSGGDHTQISKKKRDTPRMPRQAIINFARIIASGQTDWVQPFGVGDRAVEAVWDSHTVPQGVTNLFLDTVPSESKH